MGEPQRELRRNGTFPTNFLSGNDCGINGPGKTDAINYSEREQNKTVIPALRPKGYKYLARSELGFEFQLLWVPPSYIMALGEDWC